jgi:3-oxoacyl-[acyl-carrier-protein] synthase II
MTQQRQVVITGTGVVCPIGIGKPAYWQALETGTSGVGPMTLFNASQLPVTFGGEIKNFQPKEFVTPRKSLKVMCREIQTGFAAARLALDDGRLAEGTVDPERLGVVLGSEMFYCDLEEMSEPFRGAVVDGQFQMERWGPHGMNKLYPLWLLMYLPNMVACHIAIPFDARGPNNTLTIGEAGSLSAIIEAVRVIQRGHADVMLAGGTGSRINVTPLVHRDRRPLSHRQDDPAAACRPFDADRDGMVNGEGAAAFLLEAQEHAEARGATIQARILGCGLSFEGGPKPDGSGIRRALRAAMNEAALTPDQIGHVNAHGAATIDDDRREAAAIQAVLGDVPVTAPKSFFGNLGAGGGAVELAASLLAFEHDRVPFTRNYQRPDPHCPLRVVRDQPLTGRPHSAVALNHSSTGQCAALILAE